MPWTFFASTNKENSAGSRSPSQSTKRTSPVAVPVQGRLRQRQESSSSNGSWQLISATGSLRGSSGDHPGSSSSSSTAAGHVSHESSTTVIEEDFTNM